MSSAICGIYLQYVYSMSTQMAELGKLGESYTLGLEVVNAHLKEGEWAGNIPL